MKVTKKDVGNTKTLAIGGGEWALEVYNLNGDFIREFVGSNGTRDDEEADDLWGEYDDWYKNLPD